MLKAHNFNPRYQYADYRKGDKLAEYGIAALIAATAGGMLVKASGLIVLLKKFGYLLIAGIASIFYKIKNRLEEMDEKNDESGARKEMYPILSQNWSSSLSTNR